MTGPRGDGLRDARAGWRSAVHILGFIVTALACLFVIDRIVATEAFDQPVWRAPRPWALLAGLAILYAAAQGLLAIGWMTLLNTDEARVPLRRGASIYLRTVVLKYLPSNLMHFAGRYGLTLRAGAPHASIIRATLGELALQLLAAASIAALFLFPLLTETIAGMSGRTHAWLIGAAIVSCAILGACLFHWRTYLEANIRAVTTAAATAFLCYVAFFSVAGAIFLALHPALAQPYPAGGFPFILGVTATAWVVGFVVPGAPGGLGVRESVLIAGLAASAGAEAAVTLAVGYRIVTLLGDVLVSLFSYLIPKERS